MDCDGVIGSSLRPASEDRRIIAAGVSHHAEMRGIADLRYDQQGFASKIDDIDPRNFPEDHRKNRHRPGQADICVAATDQYRRAYS